jgi:two-component system, NtrC family, sensor kinase
MTCSCLRAGKRLTLCLLFLAMWLASRALRAQEPVVIEGNAPVTIGRHLQILLDEKDSLTIHQVLTKDDKFTDSEAENPNLGLTDAAIWLKFKVRNETDEPRLLLQIESPLLDFVELYSAGPDNVYSAQRAGEQYGFAARKYQSQNYIFDLTLPRGETHTYYIRIKSTEQVQLPVKVGAPKGILESNSVGDLQSGIYFGIIAIMIFYNLFIYVTIRDRSYLAYVSYITFVGLTQACLHGYTFRYLWPDSTWLAVHSIFFIPALSGISAIAFVNNFLQVKAAMPRAYKFSLVLAGVYVLGLVLGFAGVYKASYSINDFIALLLSVYILWVAIALARKGYRPAKFFLIAWSFFLASIFIFVMKSVGVLPTNNVTNYVLEIGSAIEVTLLSFALADRINILRREKEESQRRAMETLKENERIVSQQNVILEERVKERTAELETSNRNLKEAQVQLVNAEKMASLGQLTAGIAHEINNPINFVISNVNPLKRDIDDILTVLNKYETLKAEEDIHNKLKEVSELKRKLDTDYLVQEINLLLKGIGEGASRTSEIVRGLQNFSRLDEEGLKMANIHTGIDATLLLLNSNISQKKITIVKEYGNFGEVECNPGKLNQVFMNILSNAIQAFDPAQDNKEIHIQTSLDDHTLRISIRDNGPGMPEKVRSRIFEPFFTTKRVGEGSGLGLSIVYGIIEKHRGTIDVQSEPGQGTEFIIKLPVR